jgi:hypothetical protein
MITINIDGDDEQKALDAYQKYLAAVEKFEAYKVQVNHHFSNLSSRMTQIITAHEKTLKELAEVKKNQIRILPATPPGESDQPKLGIVYTNEQEDK